MRYKDSSQGDQARLHVRRQEILKTTGSIRASSLDSQSRSFVQSPPKILMTKSPQCIPTFTQPMLYRSQLLPLETRRGVAHDVLIVRIPNVQRNDKFHWSSSSLWVANNGHVLKYHRVVVHIHVAHFYLVTHAFIGIKVHLRHEQFETAGKVAKSKVVVQNGSIGILRGKGLGKGKVGRFIGNDLSTIVVGLAFLVGKRRKSPI
jgi:hypothetical protein